MTFCISMIYNLVLDHFSEDEYCLYIHTPLFLYTIQKAVQKVDTNDLAREFNDSFHANKVACICLFFLLLRGSLSDVLCRRLIPRIKDAYMPHKVTFGKRRCSWSH